MFNRLSQLLTHNTKWFEQQQNSILSAALIITVSNILSSLSGLIRERLLIGYFFGSPESQKAYEALQVAFQIPDMLFQLIVLGAVSAAFIPTFTALKKQSEAEAHHVASAVMTLTILVFGFFSVLVFIWAEPLTSMRTGIAFTPEQLVIAANLTRVMLLAQFFFAISNFLTGMLQSYQRFIVPALAPALYNFGIMAGVILFSHQLGIYSAGVGVVIGAFAHMLIQWPLTHKLGFRFKLNFDWRHHMVKRIFTLMPPRLLTVGITELENLALTFFATTIGNLSFAIINLALRLMTIPIRLFGVPISQASLPFMSEQSSPEDRKQLNQLVVQSLHQIAFFALPASVLLLILRIPIVRLVFGADNFPWRTTVLTGRVVAIIALSIAAQAMTQLLVRVFYALKDTSTPFFVTLSTVGLYVVTNICFVYFTDWGVLGLAVATLVSALLELVLFTWLLHKRTAFFTWIDVFVPQAKMICASFLMAIFLYLPFRILDELVFNTSRTLELVMLTVITGTIGMLVYLYFCVLFEVKELSYFTQVLNKFGKWRQPLIESSEVLVETSSDEHAV
jgi:putative peptidoglycan lipid II flippase